MGKIEFKKVDVDFRVVKSTNDKYLLLSLFMGQYRFPDNIQEIIDMLKSVKNGSKTWKEVIDPWMFCKLTMQVILNVIKRKLISLQIVLLLFKI